MTNIKSLAIASTGVFVVRDASGEAQFNDAGAPMTITVASPGTKQFQQAKHNFEKKKSNSVMALMTGKGDEQKGWEDDTRDLAEFLADVTVSFDNFDYEGRSAGKEAYKAAYSDIEIGHIADGLNKYLGERGNFKKPAPTASPSSSGTQPG